MGFLDEHSADQLAKASPVELTLQDLRVLQLALAGDTFAPGSQWHRAFEAASTKIDDALDQARAEALQGAHLQESRI
ncbi:hypothetical protein [Pseudomonas syringae]|uniref:hypothetical protein n=1 Tax=Pseudomonas syringae TaxID=317 RepID=UPI0002098DDC|nr:hypothetical protein [Pseudomonas syringae]MDP5168534.1 hypothetical protein [Pseudomonas syringae pv. aptata str. DSM 50252]